MKIQDVRQLILETEGCLKCPKKVFHHLLIFSYRCRGTHRVKEAGGGERGGRGGGGGGQCLVGSTDRNTPSQEGRL